MSSSPKKKKILHVGTIVGASLLLCKEMRNLGYDAQAFVTSPNKYFPECPVISKQSLYLKMLSSDVVHFHGRWKELPFGVNPSKVVFHYHGDDLREYRHYSPHKKGALFLCSSPDLAMGGYFFSKKPSDVGIIKPIVNPVDLELFVPREADQKKDVPVIIHSPENVHRIQQKGTLTIEKHLDSLKEKGYKFEYKKYDVLHSQMPEVLANSDIVIDQVISGYAGHVSFESFAMKRPVVCKILWDPAWLHNEDLFFSLEELGDMIVDETFRKSKTERGFEYVKKYHDPKVVTEQLLALYRSVNLV